MNKKDASNKPRTSKAVNFAEALVFGLFVFAGYIGAAAIEKPDLFTNSIKHSVAIVMAAFATLVFGYILVKAFQDK